MLLHAPPINQKASRNHQAAGIAGSRNVTQRMRPSLCVHPKTEFGIKFILRLEFAHKTVDIRCTY